MAEKYDLKIDLGTDCAQTRAVRLVGRNKSVLELGCATGYVSRILAEQHGCRVVGIERNPEAAAAARAVCDEVIVDDLDTLDYGRALGDRRFDVVLCGDVLEHLESPQRALADLRAFLAPGGFVVASLPNVAHASVVAELLGGRFAYRPWGLLDESHLRFFTRASIYECFEGAGFEIFHLERFVVGPADTEFRTDLAGVPEEVARAILAGEESQTYQFILAARPVPGADVEPSPGWKRAELVRRQHEADAREEEIRRLHREVALRDREVSRLHQEVAVRDDEVRRLHGEVARRDRVVEELRARPEPVVGGDQPGSVLVGIPAYNAERRIEATVRKSLAQPVAAVVVVDDGSTDGTPAILDRLSRELPAVRVIHQANRGYGGAHKVILDAFERSDADFLVVLHGDGQHEPSELVPMLHALRAGADVVLGSRALGNMLKGGMPYYKFVGNRVLTWIENLAFGTRISSFHCGFKACNRKSVAEIPYRQLTDGYHFDGQFMVVASKRGLRLEQLPVTTIYYEDGESNLRGGPYLLEIFAFIFQYHWSRARRLVRAEGRPAPF